MEDCLLEIGSKGNKELTFATMPSNSHHVTLTKILILTYSLGFYTKFLQRTMAIMVLKKQFVPKTYDRILSLFEIHKLTHILCLSNRGCIFVYPHPAFH